MTVLTLVCRRAGAGGEEEVGRGERRERPGWRGSSRCAASCVMQLLMNLIHSLKMSLRVK